MSENNSGMQPYDAKEYTQEMAYKGSGANGGLRRNGYVAGTHARVDDRARKAELKDIGIDTTEEYADIETESAHAVKVIKMQRIRRISLILFAMFILSIVTGIIIGKFWGSNIFVGLGIGTAIGIVLFVLPMIVYLLTVRNKK